MSSSASAAESEAQLAWRWEEGASRRYFVRSEVQPPSFVWMLSEINKQARAVAWQLEVVIDCVDAGPARRRGRELRCTLDDVGIRAAAMPGDSGLMAPILNELDERLTGAIVQVAQKPNGRLGPVDLEGMDERNLRLRSISENARLLLARAFAGLDLELPRGGLPRSPTWVQYQSTLLEAPVSTGSYSAAEIVHRVSPGPDPGTRMIESAGRGSVQIASDGPTSTYATRTEATAVFDVATGCLDERLWTAIGDPTAGSLVSDGTAGIAYLQRGHVQRLRPGDAPPTVLATGEMAPPGELPSALPQWQPLGLPPAR